MIADERRLCVARRRSCRVADDGWCACWWESTGDVSDVRRIFNEAQARKTTERGP